MTQTFEYLNKHAAKPIGKRMMKRLRHNNILVERAFAGALAIPNFASFCGDIHQIFNEIAPNTSGKVADYIPSLARANPEKWGVSVCTVHGQQQDWGDVNIRFSIQSTSKPLTYGMALELYGPVRLQNHVGIQPSGRRFNETILMQPEGIPHNPCINAGAIMTSAFVKMEPNDTQWDRVDYVMNVWNMLCSDGTDLETASASFQYATFLGERGTAARNNSLAWLMEEHGAFPVFAGHKVNLNDVLDAYFSWCSIELTCHQMSIVAATLANGGVNPFTAERVFMPDTVTRILSIMFSCGMYDYSGEFAYRCGLPTKSGVGGALLIVIPGVCGMCTYSPRLDSMGNSVRGVHFCQRLSEKLGVHVFGVNGFKFPEKGSDEQEAGEGVMPRNTSKTAVTQGTTMTKEDAHTELFWCCLVGDCMRIKHLIAMGCDVNFHDYDNRYPLHLAACADKVEALKLLLALHADPHVKDRYDNTPCDDAVRENAISCIPVLKEAITSAERSAAKALKLWLMGSPEESIMFANFRSKSASGQTVAEHIAPLGLKLCGMDTRIAHLNNSQNTITAESPEMKLGHVVRKALSGGLVVQNWEQTITLVEEAVNEVYEAEEGYLLNLIFSKRLRNQMTANHKCHVMLEGEQIPADTLHTTILSCDGQVYENGDRSQPCLASSIVWVAVVLHIRADPSIDLDSLVGHEPAAQSEDTLCLNSDNLPFNPFMVTGELVMCEQLVKQAFAKGFQQERIISTVFDDADKGCEVLY